MVSVNCAYPTMSSISQQKEAFALPGNWKFYKIIVAFKWAMFFFVCLKLAYLVVVKETKCQHSTQNIINLVLTVLFSIKGFQ